MDNHQPRIDFRNSLKAFGRLAWNAAAVLALAAAVWLVVTAYLLYWLAYPFDPDQITWKREIPLIMQGSADWGGSNVYAAFVFGHFAFGTAGCLLLTRVIATNWSAKVSAGVLIGFVINYVWGNVLCSRC